MMKLASYYLKSYVFIFLLQAGSSDVDKGQWSFSFPTVIKALKNSDVTIPCTFTAANTHSEVNVIWFKLYSFGYPQVFNSKDPSKVTDKYRGRTSLVGNGTDSCALRIKDVTETERFYPGISEEINSYTLHDNRAVQVKVTGCYEDGSCNDWTFRFPAYIYTLEGSCVEIPCTFTRPDDAKDFNFFWYSKRKIIFNNNTQSNVEDEYKGRTFLTGNTDNDCSLKILNVKKSEEYYPGINEDINSNKLNDRKVKVTLEVLEKTPKPLITGTRTMEDKKTFNISCSVNHTCPSNPPTITWNITGHPVMESHTYLNILGEWTMKSIMTYTASYTDDKTALQCAATFPNNKTSFKKITLNIKYRPRNITISVEGNKITQEGDNVTLLCSSQASPPVQNYSWYQIRQGRKLFQAHGAEISVKNTTEGRYICVATNEIGADESSVFMLAKQSGNGRVILYAVIGTAVGLVIVFVLVVFFSRFRRKTKTSVLDVTSTEKAEQEEIPMNDHLYGNIDQQQRATPRQSAAEIQDSSHIYDNTDAEQSKDIEKTIEEQSAESDHVLYSLLELAAPGPELPWARTSVQTEYATLKH